MGAIPVALKQTVEIAERPIGPIPRVNRYLPIPGVNRYLMDVLLTGLSNDPVDRPTAANSATSSRMCLRPVFRNEMRKSVLAKIRPPCLHLLIP